MTGLKHVRRGRVSVLLLGSVIFAFFGGPIYIGGQPKNGIVVEELEADLNANLPLGSSWEQAEGWFASHDLKPGILLRGPESGRAELLATITNDSFFDTAQIIISLAFDPEGRLERCLITRYVHNR